jgi:hypothetical protein
LGQRHEVFGFAAEQGVIDREGDTLRESALRRNSIDEMVHPRDAINICAAQAGNAKDCPFNRNRRMRLGKPDDRLTNMLRQLPCFTNDSRIKVKLLGHGDSLP